MFDLDKPVIAAVNGMAVGGGFELLLACDLIVAAEHAELFLPELSRGIVPDAGGVQRLPGLLPRGVALDLLLTSRRMSAREAQQWGLVRSVVPGERLMEEARELAARVAAAAPLATQATKQVLRGTAGLSAEEAFAAMGSGRFPAYDRALASDESHEGARAFAEGRPAQLRVTVALISGGGTGLGRATALELGRGGAQIAICGRRPEPLEATRAELEALGAECLAVPADLREGAEPVVDAALEAFGRVDVLVNNAGGQFTAPAEEISLKGWRAVHRLNVDAVWDLTREVAVRSMIPGDGGVVFFNGFSPRRGLPGYAHAAAARAALENLTRGLAVEWAPHGIRTIFLALGSIHTEGLESYGDDLADERRPGPARAPRAVPRRWRPRSPSWPRRPPATSPGARSRSTAASTPYRASLKRPSTAAAAPAARAHRALHVARHPLVRAAHVEGRLVRAVQRPHRHHLARAPGGHVALGVGVEPPDPLAVEERVARLVAEQRGQHARGTRSRRRGLARKGPSRSGGVSEDRMPSRWIQTEDQTPSLVAPPTSQKEVG